MIGLAAVLHRGDALFAVIRTKSVFLKQLLGIGRAVFLFFCRVCLYDECLFLDAAVCIGFCIGVKILSIVLEIVFEQHSRLCLAVAANGSQHVIIIQRQQRIGFFFLFADAHTRTERRLNVIRLIGLQRIRGINLFQRRLFGLLSAACAVLCRCCTAACRCQSHASGEQDS